MNTAAPMGLSEIHESERLALLALSKWLDAETPPALDSVVRLAAALTGCEVAVVNLVDAHRLYALARHGIQSRHATREGSWCNQAIEQTGVLQCTAPESPVWQFYAGIPIVVEGHALATLCVMDKRPQALDHQQLSALQDLAQIVQAELAGQVANRRARREASRVRTASLAGSDWLWETDHQGHLQWVSPSLRQHTGLDPVAEIGLRAKDIYTPSPSDNGASWDRYVLARTRREPFSDALAERMTPRGRMVVSISGLPVFNQEGQFMGYRGASRNVTRHLALEEQARRRNDLLLEATETFHASVMITDPQGKILHANKHWLDAVGLSDLDNAPTWPAMVRDLIRRGHYPDAAGQEDDFYDLRVNQYKEDRARVIRLHNRVILARDQKLSDGNILHFATDITQAHVESLVVEEQQLALLASEARLKAVLNALPDLWFVIDDQGCYRDGHRTHPMMLRPFEELKGKPFGSIVAPELAARELQAITRAHETGQAQRLEYSLATSDGIMRQFEGRMVPMPDGKSLFLTRDMTEFKALERDIRTLQQVLQADLSLGLMVMDANQPEHPVLYATPGSREFLGLPIKALEGRPWLAMLAELGDNDAGLALLAQSMHEGLPCVALLSRQPSAQDEAREERTFELRLTPLKDHDGKVSHFIALVHDVTDRQMAAERLRLSEERWKFALEGAGDGVWDWDLSSDHSFYSARCRSMLGLGDDELGDSPLALRSRIHPDDLAQANEAFDTYRLDGMGILQLECRFQHHDGHYLWLLTRGKVVARDTHGRPTRIVGTFSDITPIKQAERALRDKLSAEAANRAKSEFLSRMSHEIRTPLNAVHGFAQLLKQRLDDTRGTVPGVDLHDYAHQILTSSDHLSDLVNEVLDLQQIEAGVVTLKQEWVDLSTVLDRCLQMMQPLAHRYGVQVQIMADTGWHVWTDPRRLKQVLNNLVSNAIKYNRPSGQVRAIILPHGDEGVQVIVEDTGLGMDSGQLARLFQPFERLGRDTSTIEGSGLGLVITRSLIEVMGGNIEIRSATDMGTRISFVLPKATRALQIQSESPPIGTQAPEPQPECIAANEQHPDMTSLAHSADHPLKVLYVEDNRINALLFEEALRPYPFLHLEVAEDGQMAMSVGRDFIPHVLVVDAHLPGMTGFEVLHALRTLPELQDAPAYMCSADALPEDIAKAQHEGFVGYWTKPIDIPQVINELSRLARQPPETAHNAAS